MAKVNISYDTKDKSCSLSMDGIGMDVEDVRGLSMYKNSEGKWSMSVGSYKLDKENDVVHYHDLMASEKTPKTLKEQIVAFIEKAK